ncbi:MAG: glycosyltransferase [Acidimicrobiales bacterium]
MRVPSPAIPRFADSRFPAPSFGFLSTYPPTACGIATFSAALSKGLVANGAEVGIVRVADGSPASDKAVVGELDNGSARSVAAASEVLNRFDVAIVQHEYGLYGGADGDEVLDVLESLDVPSIVIAHTILSRPTPHQQSVLEAVAAVADQVVVMSAAAQERLCSLFDIDPAIVTTIPHGAAIPTSRPSHQPIGRPTILTWGLIGPGKGIERVIDAMVSLHDLPSRPCYLVAGRTHPRVLASDGEAYRNARIEQASRNGVAESVIFDATYRNVGSLTALIQSCAVVVLPYDTADQVTSGVLVDAIAAGRPVVATAFPHAVELLASGAGIVVDHDDPDALVSALRRLLLEPGLADAMGAEASRLAPTMAWSVVAGAYLGLGSRLLRKHPALV